MAGFEHLYRQGVGEAAVINLGGVVNQYAQQLQNQALRRQKEQEAYAKELEKINYDGVRQADVVGAQKRWLAVKDKYHELSKTDKDSDKLRIRSEISALKNDLTSFAGRSKDQKKVDLEIAKAPLTANPYELVPDFGERLKTREQLSIEDPRFSEFGIDKFQKLARPYDTTKNLMDLANISSTEKEIPITIGTGIDARRGYKRGKIIDPVAFKSAFLKNITEDAHARDTYLNGMAPTPENLEDAAEAAYQIVKDKFGLETSESNYIDPSGRQLSLAESTAKINAKYRPAKDGDDDNSYTMIDMVLPYGDGASFSTNQYIPISIPEKNFAGSSYIDMKTGKPGTKKLSSSGDYEMVGVVNMPMIKRGSGAKDGSGGLDGAIAQPNFEKNNPGMVEYVPMIHVQKPTGAGGFKYDYLIPYNRMPENVKNTGAVKKALAKFRPASAPAPAANQIKKVIKGF